MTTKRPLREDELIIERYFEHAPRCRQKNDLLDDRSPARKDLDSEPARTVKIITGRAVLDNYFVVMTKSNHQSSPEIDDIRRFMKYVMLIPCRCYCLAQCR